MLAPLPTLLLSQLSQVRHARCQTSALALCSTTTTRIYGIANQRVKECNRIQAMEDELAKFGVTCRQFDDGIEVDGKAYELEAPKAGIHCYDDHRVAMSFAVLSLVAPAPVLILEKECTGKTWPGYWDILHQLFKAELEKFRPHQNRILQAIHKQTFQRPTSFQQTKL